MKKIEIDKEYLYQLYIIENKSCLEISKIFKCSVFPIKKAITRFGFKKSISQIKTATKLTCLKKYNDEYPMQNDVVKKKRKTTIYNKYGTLKIPALPQIAQKTKRTNIDRYNCEYAFQNESVKAKIKNTLRKKYSVVHNSQLKDFNEKVYQTKKKNNTFGKSKQEIYILEKLKERYPYTIFQYKSKEYPFNCDFYIPELKLYIEYQGYWSHGMHPYNPTDINDLKQVELWTEKAKNSKIFLKCIYDWTVRDPKKRALAKKNGLNWKEFFTLEEFTKWFDSLA